MRGVPSFPFSLQPDGQLHRPGGDKKCCYGGDEANHDDLEQAALHIVQIIHDGDSSGNKEEGHIIQEEIRLFADMVDLELALQKQQKYENHTDNAGWKGEGQELGDCFTQQTEGKNNCQLQHHAHGASAFREKFIFYDSPAVLKNQRLFCSILYNAGNRKEKQKFC